MKSQSIGNPGLCGLTAWIAEGDAAGDDEDPDVGARSTSSARGKLAGTCR